MRSKPKRDHNDITQDAAEPIYTARDFALWLATAGVGDRCCYWVGQLAADRALDGPFEPSNLLGSAAREAGERGDVFLLQKHLGEFKHRTTKRAEYAYLAVKASESGRHYARSEPMYGAGGY